MIFGYEEVRRGPNVTFHGLCQNHAAGHSLLKMTDPLAGHAKSARGPHLARGPGFAHPWSSGMILALGAADSGFLSGRYRKETTHERPLGS